MARKFQSTLPRRERQIMPRLTPRQFDFNPRSREGSDAYQSLRLQGICRFQSTLPRRERQYLLVDRLSQILNFNPRSREGSDSSRLSELCQRGDFNPRSREGSDEMTGYEESFYQISIHAPAKGATSFLISMQSCFKISIHAPAKGATKS